MLNVIDFIRESIKDSRALRSLFVRRVLPCTVTKGANWESAEATAQIVGNVIGMYFTATRKSPTAVGNISNEDVCTVEIDPQGLFEEILGVSLCSGSTGPMATFQITDIKKVGSKISFDIRIVATAAAVTDTNAYFLMLVVPDIGAYRSGGGYCIACHISERRWQYA